MRRLAVAAAIVLLAVSCRQKAWKAIPLHTKADFRDLYFADAQHGWIGGGGYDIPGGLVGRTSDGGRTWRFQSGMLSPVREAAGLKFEALHFFNERRGLAACDGGKVMETSDGGENWGDTVVRGNFTPFLFDLAFIDEQTGWSIGSRAVFKTEDGGRNWREIAPRMQGRAIAFVDSERGFLVGQHGIAMRSDDGGRVWTQMSVPSKTDFWDLFFIDERNGWISGADATLLHTTNGGATWTRCELPDVPADLTLASVRFADPKNGWIVAHVQNMGRSLILRTVDGGEKWMIDADIEGEELRRIFVLDREHVWAIGARTRPGQQAIYVRGK